MYENTKLFITTFNEPNKFAGLLCGVTRCKRLIFMQKMMKIQDIGRAPCNRAYTDSTLLIVMLNMHVGTVLSWHSIKTACIFFDRPPQFAPTVRHSDNARSPIQIRIFLNTRSRNALLVCVTRRHLVGIFLIKRFSGYFSNKVHYQSHK